MGLVSDGRTTVKVSEDPGGTTGLGSWLMKKGAELVTEDRKATAAVGAGYAGFAREMVRHFGQSGGRSNPPALPLATQEGGAWLPDLQEFEEAEFSEVDERRE